MSLTIGALPNSKKVQLGTKNKIASGGCTQGNDIPQSLDLLLFVYIMEIFANCIYHHRT